MNKNSWNPKNLSLDQYVQPILQRLPVVSHYATTRGWPFVISWIHRISGTLLALYFCVHIYTLAYLADPAVYDAKMKIFGYAVLAFLEWLLAVPVILHALNGGRLILFEIFGSRRDNALIRWMLSLTAAYALLLGLLMIRQDQYVSLVLFWLPIFFFNVCLVYLVVARIGHLKVDIGWKIHRVTGVYLLLMVPAHLLFMHLHPAAAHDANAVIDRMQNLFVKIMDLTLVIGVGYHAGYGLVSIAKDYLPSGILQKCMVFLITFIFSVFGYIGMKLAIII
jgi:succinate dehydrogenase hydrophobic anchor subunit